MPEEKGSLRQRVIRGGAYLTARQALGIAIHVVGVVLLTRQIGPANYGIYTAALAVVMYLYELTVWGVGVYLVRRPEELDARVLRQASTLLLGLGLAGMAAGQLALPAISGWIGIEELGAVGPIMLLGLPVMLLRTVPVSALERNLDYRRVAWIELGGVLLFYVVALTLAARGYGAWAPVIGWWAQEAMVMIAAHLAAGHVPVPYWDRKLVRGMVGYGLSFSAAIWVWQLRTLVNPLIVGRFVGADGVGVVSLTIQLVRNLGFVMSATWRLSTAALARVQDEVRKLVGAVEEGMLLQTLAVGPPLVLFAWVAPWLIPLVFGDEWLPVVSVFPFIALGYLTNAVFNLHSSALFVRERNWSVAVFHMVHVALFGGAAALLVGPMGLTGYGWAEVAAIPSYLVVHAALARHFEAPRYAVAPWWAAFSIALFAHQLGWWVVLAPVLVLALPATRQLATGQLRALRGAGHG